MGYITHGIPDKNTKETQIEEISAKTIQSKHAIKHTG